MIKNAHPGLCKGGAWISGKALGSRRKIFTEDKPQVWSVKAASTHTKAHREEKINEEINELKKNIGDKKK